MLPFRPKGNMKRYLLLGVLLFVCPSFAQSSNQCLIVKQNKGHRVRNGFQFGVAGLAFSKGERYEYVDSLNFPNSRLKYKGDELQKLKDTGVHVIVINKDAAGEEIQSARSSCKETSSAVEVIPPNPTIPSTNLVHLHVEDATKSSVNSSAADTTSSKVKPAVLISKDAPMAAVQTQTTSSSAQANGTASVTSDPDGAEIFVDSVGRGHTPSLLKLKPGKHQVQVVLQGYKDWLVSLKSKLIQLSM
jgi:hypothetical protein